MMQKLLAESLSRSMYANCGIAGGDSSLLGEGVERSFSKIDFAECLAVGGLNLIEGPGDAAAYVCRCEIRSSGWRIYLCCKGLEGARFECAVTIVVDYCVAKDAEEPGVGCLLGLQIFDL
jgi:hypothetical protein